MYIDQLMIDSGPDTFYDDNFRNVLEDHMSYLRTLNSTYSISIDAQQAYVFTGDLQGLLQANGIAPELWWIVMRLNNFKSHSDIDGTLSYLLIPSQQVINQLLSGFFTQNGIVVS